MNYWFISDIHLRDVNERNGNTLLRFLFFLNRQPKNHILFLVGDIFDFWLSNGRAFAEHYQLLINEIRRLKENGGQVYYFEGNHDFHIDTFWTKKLGIEVIENFKTFNLDGLKVRVEHGDFINPDDQAYLQYRALVRKPWLELIGHTLPGFFWKWFGERQSQKSRKKTSHYAIQNSEKIVQLIRRYAENLHRAEKFDLLITGHMHVPDDYSFSSEGRAAHSINLGT